MSRLIFTRTAGGFLVSIISTLAFPILAAAQNQLVCPGLDESAQKLATTKISSLDHAFVDGKSKPVFFIGLWSRMDERQRRALAQAVHKKPEAEIINGVRNVMNTLSSRLSEDRHELVTWVEANRLTADVEVQSIPVDGSFLLLKATKSGLQAIICASAGGVLPAILTDLSN